MSCKESLSSELLDKSNNDQFSRNGEWEKLQPQSAPSSHDCQMAGSNVIVAVSFQEYCKSGSGKVRIGQVKALGHGLLNEIHPFKKMVYGLLPAFN